MCGMASRSMRWIVDITSSATKNIRAGMSARLFCLERDGD